MSLLLEVSRIAVVANLGLLIALGYVWVGSYRRYRASFSLALSIFAGLLFIQNVVWFYLYVGHGGYIGWFQGIDTTVQVALMSLCALETLALGFLAWITLR